MLGETAMPTYFMNSILVTGTSVVLILVLGTMAGYAVARYESRTNTFILLFFLAGLMLPLKLAVIPLFILLRDLGLLDSRWSLIVTYTAIGLPSAVFIMAGFLRTLPAELEDAARIDGASEPRIMWSVMLPLARPPMAIAAIQNAVPIWNDFFFPLVFIQTDARQDPAAGPDHLHGRIHHRLGHAVRRPHHRGGADHASLHRPVAPVHPGHDGRRGEVRNVGC